MYNKRTVYIYRITVLSKRWKIRANDFFTKLIKQFCVNSYLTSSNLSSTIPSLRSSAVSVLELLLFKCTNNEQWELSVHTPADQKRLENGGGRVGGGRGIFRLFSLFPPSLPRRIPSLFLYPVLRLECWAAEAELQQCAVYIVHIHFLCNRTGWEQLYLIYRKLCRQTADR